MKISIVFLILLIVETIGAYSMINLNNFEFENTKKCQSGLREDNTNYVYCARQNLTKVPNFFQSTTTADHLVSNIIYDELVLSDNFISFIDSNSLNIKVRKLYLDTNPIRFIEPNAFDYIRNYLEEVYFEFKRLDSNNLEQDANLDDFVIFEHSILQSCFNLQLLSIKSYQINELRPLKFRRLTKLEILTLSNLKLKKIDKDSFIGLEQSLIELNLDSNLLDIIPNESIEILKKLKRLNLAQNRIKNLQANTFFKFSSSFNTLDLSYNYLSSIDENAFSGPIQNSLKSLQLKNNELKWSNFINLLFNLYQLQDLNIDFNKLSITNNVKSSNSLFNSKINDSIDLKLINLSMQGNGLSEQSLSLIMGPYDYETVNNQNLKRNDYLQLKQFKYANLIKLNLARNKIKSLPENFFKHLNMTKLKGLVLDRNNLNVSAFYSDTFSGLEKSLINLSISSANLKWINLEFVDALNKLTNLESLKLNGNSIQALKLFSNLKLSKLESLELQNNNLINLPEMFCNLKNLTNLDINSNHIKTIDLKCLADSKLKQLNLNNNPLICDCNLKELKNWLNKNLDKDLVELIKWKCNEPVELNGKYFTDILYDDFKCQTENKYKTIEFVSYYEKKYEPVKEPIIITTMSTLQTKIKSTLNSTIYTTFSASKIKDPSLQSRQTILSTSQTELSLNYFSLIIGILLGVSFVCLIVLITFYTFYVRVQNKTKTNNILFYGTGSDKYENKNFCSPLSSISSADSTTLSNKTKYSSSQPIDSILITNDYLNSQLTSFNDPNLIKGRLEFSNEIQFSQNYYDKPIEKNRNFNNNYVEFYNQTNTSLDYNNLNYDSTIFSITNHQNESHIYHEIINKPSSDAEYYQTNNFKRCPINSLTNNQFQQNNKFNFNFNNNKNNYFNNNNNNNNIKHFSDSLIV